MKLVFKCLEKDKSGEIGLQPEDSEDMWHLYNLIIPGDSIKASTVRRIQTTTVTGSSDSYRTRLTLNIKAESVDFDTQVCQLRVNGRVCEENADVKMGSYHTIDLELNRKVTIRKEEWDIISLDRLHKACDVTERAEVAAIVMQEGIANVCLLTENMTIVRQRIEVNIPKKRKGSTSQYEKSLNRFFQQIYQAIGLNFNFEVVKCVLIASPGFTKDQFYKYVMEIAVREENKLLIANKKKFLLVHSHSGHKHALEDVLEDPTVKARLSDTKYMQETKALEDFFEMLNNDPDRAFYGWDHVNKAASIGAISTLLITDSLFRSPDIRTRKQYIKLVESVRKMGGKSLILSSLHVSGEHLQQMTGIAAILSYPAPHIEEEDV